MIVIIYLIGVLFVFLICYNFCCMYYKANVQHTSFNKWLEEYFAGLLVIALVWPLGIFVVLALYLMQTIKKYHNI